MFSGHHRGCRCCRHYWIILLLFFWQVHLYLYMVGASYICVYICCVVGLFFVCMTFVPCFRMCVCMDWFCIIFSPKNICTSDFSLTMGITFEIQAQDNISITIDNEVSPYNHKTFNIFHIANLTCTSSERYPATDRNNSPLLYKAALWIINRPPRLGSALPFATEYPPEGNLNLYHAI